MANRIVNRPRRFRENGFTLVELMTAVSVLAILASIAVPSYREFTANQRIRAASFDLRTDLMLARSEALKRNADVAVQRRLAAGWQTGWIVVANGETLRSRNDIGNGVTMSAAASAIIFNGNGRVSSPAGSVQIDLATAVGSTNRHRCLTLDPAGMPRTYTESCS